MLSTPLTPLIRGGEERASPYQVGREYPLIKGGRESIPLSGGGRESIPLSGGKRERVLTTSAPPLRRGRERKYSSSPPLIRPLVPPLIRGVRGVLCWLPPYKGGGEKFYISFLTKRSRGWLFYLASLLTRESGERGRVCILTDMYN